MLAQTFSAHHARCMPMRTRWRATYTGHSSDRPVARYADIGSSWSASNRRSGQRVRTGAGTSTPAMTRTSASIARLTAVPIAPGELSTCSSAGESFSSKRSRRPRREQDRHGRSAESPPALLSDAGSIKGSPSRRRHAGTAWRRSICESCEGLCVSCSEAPAQRVFIGRTQRPV